MIQNVTHSQGTHNAPIIHCIVMNMCFKGRLYVVFNNIDKEIKMEKVIKA